MGWKGRKNLKRERLITEKNDKAKKKKEEKEEKLKNER